MPAMGSEVWDGCNGQCSEFDFKIVLSGQRCFGMYVRTETEIQIVGLFLLFAARLGLYGSNFGWSYMILHSRYHIQTDCGKHLVYTLCLPRSYEPISILSQSRVTSAPG